MPQNPSMKLKISGAKPDIEALLEALEKEYFIFPTSKYLDNEDGSSRRYVTILSKVMVTH